MEPSSESVNNDVHVHTRRVEMENTGKSQLLDRSLRVLSQKLDNVVGVRGLIVNKVVR